jgi:Ca-activated chloride channel family protein
VKEDTYPGNTYPSSALNYNGEYDNGENYEDYGENPFISVLDQPESTFSVDADGGSYANMRRYRSYGQMPPVASVRIEEYINYFAFDYPEPSSEHNVSLNSELSTCPWNEEHFLMRIGMKGKTIPKDELPGSNYVFLIDVSGSMSAPEKLGILKTGFKRMVDHLRDVDRVAIVTYAGSAGVLLESTYGDSREVIKNAIDKLGAGGSTAGAQGIITAYNIAEKNFIVGGNNRVILGSDGDFNVGASSTDELVALLEEKRESGIYLTVLGVGSGNLNDHMMEQIANNGNGNYEYIDSEQQIEKVFIQEYSKFYTVAKDAKINITFNPEAVEAYRLIGYENRALENEEFENDSVDAGEIGSGQTITALYELILVPNGQSKFGQFDFRYKKPDTNESQLISHSINGVTPNIMNASDNMRFAASVTALGLLMKESQYKGSCSKQLILDLGKNAVTYDPYGYRDEFLSIVEGI